MALDRADIQKLFELLNAELQQDDVKGELYLVGGAVMCLVFNARQSTQDLDAFFQPADRVREAARRVAARSHRAPDWLNDGVKGYLSSRGVFQPYLALPNLTVLTASPEYLLAMKCLAMRLGAEFHDESDIRYLLRFLNIDNYAAAIEIVARYYPLERIPQKTLYALEEMLSTGGSAE
jgi:hypothetical protein